MSLIDESLFKSAERDNARRAIPDGRKRVAYRKMLTGLVFLGIFVVFGPTYHYGIAITPWFMTKGFIYRFVTCSQSGGSLMISNEGSPVFNSVDSLSGASTTQFGRSQRFSYYDNIHRLDADIGGQGASILTGLGFTGYGASGESTWNGAANVKIKEIELPPNFKVLLDSWNINTNIWLRECIYKRVTPKGKKPGFRSSMLTFATSAFWVGPSGMIRTSADYLAAWDCDRLLHDVPFWWIHHYRRPPLPYQHTPISTPLSRSAHDHDETHLRLVRNFRQHSHPQLCCGTIHAP